MATKDRLTGSRFVSTITELVDDQGITLETGSDFSFLQKALKDQPERNALAPRFSPQGNDLNEETAFWILGRDPQGEIVHTQAVRTIDLEGLTLASYMDAQFRDFTPAGYGIDMRRSQYRGAPGSRMIAGKVCYHGELWLKGGPGGYRGAGMTAILARLAMAISLEKWSPDYVFGFMFPLAACKGLAAREGYMHTEPGSLYWAVPGQREKMEVWTVWMGREDIRHILQIPPTSLFEQLEASQLRSRREKAA
ncbi:hypothetical protein HBA54_08650 [Pelagibius litoralis]|uniref:Uncharacterized protein n=1 Tax=Pelagibius litoralis TaxID=374515 RepID=A0A967EVX9_9PROT|nr:hypothetical protein [Pelagibius litoralis]NIA68659.1 hypothetical protein [Pelagibius litoralis]